MPALLMCGGRGKRLGMGEKPLVRVCGKRLIEHVLDALLACRVFAAVTDYTPSTARFLYALRRENLSIVKTPGSGFIEDMRYAIKKLQVFEPVIVVSSDLVFFRNPIPEIIDAFISAGSPALTTAYEDGGFVGINIVDGKLIDVEQEEIVYRVKREDVLNINTPDDVRKAEALWNGKIKEGGWWKD